MAEPVVHPRTLVLGCDVNCVPNLPPLLTEVMNLVDKDAFGVQKLSAILDMIGESS
jgi:hypothetical protein